jgi:toxin-antitoxin system PIN domain toxin
MSLIDANLLIYAYQTSSSFHDEAKEWFEVKLSTRAYFSWSGIQAFLRTTTSRGFFGEPFSPKEATAIVDRWLERPQVSILETGTSHWSILSGLIRQYEIRGKHVTDAHLAALAIEHGVILATNDRDFRRFEGLRLDFPLLKSSAG